VDGTLVLTSLREKKWRRMVAKGTDTQTAAPSPPPKTKTGVTVTGAMREDIYKFTSMGWTVSQIASALKINPQIVRAIQKGRN
jgi:hypothetical protein